MALTFGSLFAGIGGLDLGLERAGMECRWQVEIDPFCQKVLQRHWPHVPKFGDIKELSGDELEPVDLICGGFPCQPVSLAGKRRGQQDDRWLWPEFARLLRHLRPRYVLVENVPGLLVGPMGDVLADLAALGFDAEWESIPAAAVGAPHLRWRVFLVAYASGEPQRLEQVCQPGGDSAYVAGHDGCHGQAADSDSSAGRRQRATGQAGRVADGVPARLDRLRALGNAVVPQVAEYVGHAIVTADKARAAA